MRCTALFAYTTDKLFRVDPLGVFTLNWFFLLLVARRRGDSKEKKKTSMTTYTLSFLADLASELVSTSE